MFDTKLKRLAEDSDVGRATISLLILGCFVVLFLLNFHNTWDDSYISFRYAKNLNQFGSLTYNGSDKTEGYSNFLLVFIMALFLKIGIQPIIVSKLVGLLSGLLSIFLVGKLFTLLLPEYKSFKVYPMLLLATSFGYSVYSAVGLETILYSFLLILGVYQLINFINYQNPTNIWFVFFLIVLCRPEGFIFVPMLIVGYLIYFFTNGKNHKVLLYNILILVVLSFAYYILKFKYFGIIFPSTYYAKVPNNFINNIIAGLNYSYLFIKSNLIEVIVLFFGGFLSIRNIKISNNNLNLLYVLLFFVGYISYIVVVGGDHGPFPGFRSFVYIYPLFALLTGVSIVNVYKKIDLKPFIKLTALNLTVLLIIFSNISTEFKLFDKVYNKGIRNYIITHYSLKPPLTLHKKIAEYLKENVPGNEYIAISEAGAIPYYSEKKFIDYLGLNNKEIALMIYKGDYHKIARYTLQQKPYAIVTLDIFNPKKNIIVPRSVIYQNFYEDPIFKKDYYLKKEFLVRKLSKNEYVKFYVFFKKNMD